MKRELGNELLASAQAFVAVETLQSQESAAAAAAASAAEDVRELESKTKGLKNKTAEREEMEGEGSDVITDADIEARLGEQTERIKDLSTQLAEGQDALYAVECEKLAMEAKVEVKVTFFFFFHGGIVFRVLFV